MAIVISIVGESGTGKSSSMRNLDEKNVCLVNVNKKPLPFKSKGDIETLDSDNYRKIKKFISETKRKIIVIDDAQYLMGNEFMRRGLEKGFDKFTEIAMDFWKLIQFCTELDFDKTVYLLSHVERDQNGNEKMKTIGKMLDEKITLEGMFSIVLKTAVKDGNYTFVTQNNGHDTTKSPIGLFDSYEIPNDLALVDKKIRSYYDLEFENYNENIENYIIDSKEESTSVKSSDDLETPEETKEEKVETPETNKRKRKKRG